MVHKPQLDFDIMCSKTISTFLSLINSMKVKYFVHQAGLVSNHTTGIRTRDLHRTSWSYANRAHVVPWWGVDERET